MSAKRRRRRWCLAVPGALAGGGGAEEPVAMLAALVCIGCASGGALDVIAPAVALVSFLVIQFACKTLWVTVQ